MEMNKYRGKYRGRVEDNIDPLEIGRLKVSVPEILGTALGWALPCASYAEPLVIPPVGANVWVEFEGGNLEYPIWVGCFWSPETILQVVKYRELPTSRDVDDPIT